MKRFSTINNPEQNSLHNTDNIKQKVNFYNNIRKHPFNKLSKNHLSIGNSEKINASYLDNLNSVVHNQSVKDKLHEKSVINAEKLRRVYIGKNNRIYQQKMVSVNNRYPQRHHSLQDSIKTESRINRKHKILVSQSEIQLINNKRSQKRLSKAKINNNRYSTFLEDIPDKAYQKITNNYTKMMPSPNFQQKNPRSFLSHKKLQKRLQLQQNHFQQQPVHTIFNNYQHPHRISEFSNQNESSLQSQEQEFDNLQIQNQPFEQMDTKIYKYLHTPNQKTNFNHNKGHQEEYRDNKIIDKYSWLPKNYQPKSTFFKDIEFSNFKIKKYKSAVYFGQLNLDGHKEGKGVLFYHNGKSYEGIFHNDLKHGEGLQIYPDSSKFYGQYFQGLKNGKGTYQWANGQIYQGQWMNNLRNGSGFWKCPSGQSYIGQWKDNRIEGFGVYLSKNGDRYQGQFINFTKNGYGTERYANNDTYVGNYRKNLPNGEGQYFWSNGCYYKGQFCNGLRHGRGIFKDEVNPKQDEQLIYQGFFTNDKKSGYGELKCINKKKYLMSEYIGNFQNDLKHGYGQMATYQLAKDGRPNFLKEIKRGYWMNDIFFQEHPSRQEQSVNINMTPIPEKLIPQKTRKNSKLNIIHNETIPRKQIYRSLDRSPYRINNYLKPTGCIKIH